MPLPQNIISLIGEVGEETVLLQLSLMCIDTPWQVYRNVGDAGYDILLINEQTGERVRVEVKTRQRIVSKQSITDRVNFTATNNEYDNLEVMVCYFFDSHDVYVIPKVHLKTTKAKVDWNWYLDMDENGKPSEKCAKYLDAWRHVHLDFESLP